MSYVSSKNSYIFRTSKDDYYTFALDSNRTLSIEDYSKKESLLFKRNILDFSLDIDQRDRIHALFLNQSGELRYDIFPQVMRETMLTKLDLINYSIRFIKLKLINSDVHIFYMLSAKNNTNYWAIYHTFFTNNQWNSVKAAEIYSEKAPFNFTIDTDNNFIYLFYSKKSDQVYTIKKFDLSESQWLVKEDNISLENVHSISFMVNDKSFGIICYNVSMDKNIQVFIKYKDMNTDAYAWSNDILISSKDVNAVHPCMLSKDNYTYLIWEEGNNIIYRKSFYGNHDWEEKTYLAPKSTNLFNIMYKSNNSTDKSFKSNFTLVSADSYPRPLIYLEGAVNSSNSSSSMNVNARFSTPTKISVNPKTTQVDFTQELKELIIIKNTQISKLEDELKIIREDLELSNKSTQDLCSETDSLKNKLKDIEEYIEEKNKMIENLNKIICKLYEEIDKKETQLNLLKSNEKRGFFNNLFKSQGPS